VRGTVHLVGVEEHITREKIASAPGRSRAWRSSTDAEGPHREGEEPRLMMHAGEPSGASEPLQFTLVCSASSRPMKEAAN
jgi:hypothetical protein